MKHLPVFDLSPYIQSTRAGDLSSCIGKEGMPSSSASSTSAISFPACSLSPEIRLTCEDIASCLKETSALIVRDPRCSLEDSNGFLDMMEKYFEREKELKLKDARPQLHYQVGVTPEAVEVPRCVMEDSVRAQILQQAEEDRAHIPSGPDPKWRFMWRVGPRPTNTKYKELNSEPVIPEGFPDWSRVMDGWGTKMLAAVEVVAEMAAIGLGLEQDAFTSLMHEGPHLLGPTGSDLSKHGEEGMVFAGYHYDLNFLTIHGQARFPGLFIWLRNGRKVGVSVPEGCLLLQAGKQLEWLTGGEVMAGMHEVVVTDATMASIERAKGERKSLWRVSSTVFSHINSDRILRPLGRLAESVGAEKYSPMVTGDFVEKELLVIKLKGDNVDGVGEENVPKEKERLEGAFVLTGQSEVPLMVN